MSFKNLYRKLHPNEFSDSKIIKRALINNDCFKYFLSTVTSQNKEYQFESFVRELIKKEICPNILEHTGPMGGGDSKVDTETYHVSKSISENLLIGFDANSKNEKWAFAISAAQNWRSKCSSDIKKIFQNETNSIRKYTKFFYISNQYISDKKRSELSDSLSKQYNIEVVILDINWIIDRTLKNDTNREIAIKQLGLSNDLKDEVLEGSEDHRRKLELESIEKKLQDISTKPYAKVLDSQRTIVLVRELCLNIDDVEKHIKRAERYAKEYGTSLDVAKVYYNAAITMFWWYDNIDKFNNYYMKFEKIAYKNLSCNSLILNYLIVLFINYNSVNNNNSDKIKIDMHKKIIYNIYNNIINLGATLSSVEAETYMTILELVLDNNLDNAIEKFIKIIEKSESVVGYDYNIIYSIINEIKDWEKIKNIDVLFDMLIKKISANANGLAKASMLMLKTKKEFLNNTNQALETISECCRYYIDSNNLYGLTDALHILSLIYAKLGMVWASRNISMFELNILINQTFKYGVVDGKLILSLQKLKYDSIKIGYITEAIEFNNLQNIFSDSSYDDIELSNDSEMSFDGILSILISRTDFSNYEKMTKFPIYLNKNSLYNSFIITKYMLGYYDKEALKSLNMTEQDFDKYYSKILNYSTNSEIASKPFYGFEDKIKISTSILGCTINLNIKINDHNLGFSLGASVLAAIENIFSSISNSYVYSISESIDIDMKWNSSINKILQFSFVNCENTIIIEYSDYDYTIKETNTKNFNETIDKLLVEIIKQMFPFSEQYDKFFSVTTNSNIKDRTKIILNSAFSEFDTLGSDTFSYNSIVHNIQNEIKCIQSIPIHIEKSKESNADNDLSNYRNVIFDKPPKDYYKNINFNDFHTIGLIDVLLWNSAKWKAVAYGDNSYYGMPLFSFCFQNKDGLKIFMKWREKIGLIDKNNEIVIAIIKGISKDAKNDYRVVIGCNTDNINVGSYKAFLMPSRLMTMNVDNTKNLDNFITQLSHSKQFIICPSIMNNYIPKIYEKVSIIKNIDSIKVVNAHEIIKDDILIDSAILPTDTPYIPIDVKNPYILEIIKRKKNKK